MLVQIYLDDERNYAEYYNYISAFGIRNASYSIMKQDSGIENTLLA